MKTEEMNKMADQFRLMLQATLNKLSERLPISSEWHTHAPASEPMLKPNANANANAQNNAAAGSAGAAGGGVGAAGAGAGAGDFPHLSKASAADHYLVNAPKVTPLVQYSVGDGISASKH